VSVPVSQALKFIKEGKIQYHRKEKVMRAIWVSKTLEQCGVSNFIIPDPTATPIKSSVTEFATPSYIKIVKKIKRPSVSVPVSQVLTSRPKKILQ